MRHVRVLLAASQEAIEAAAHYEAERPGLGRQFEQAIDDALNLLREDVVPLLSVSPV
jgi:hypothetical protein